MPKSTANAGPHHIPQSSFFRVIWWRA
jgi:hypothetical protein